MTTPWKFGDDLGQFAAYMRGEKPPPPGDVNYAGVDYYLDDAGQVGGTFQPGYGFIGDKGPTIYRTDAVVGVTDQTKVFKSGEYSYVPAEYSVLQKSQGFLSSIADFWGPPLAMVAAGWGIGGAIGALAGTVESGAIGALDATNYSLTAGGIPSLGSGAIAAGESLSVYGTSGLAGTGFASLGSGAAGGLISGAAATSAGWALPSAGDAWSALKSGSSAANTAAKLTGAGGATAPILAKGNGMDSLKLSNNLSGVPSPMSSSPVSSPLNAAFAGDPTKAVIIGATLVGLIYLLTKGGK